MGGCIARPPVLTLVGRRATDRGVRRRRIAVIAPSEVLGERLAGTLEGLAAARPVAPELWVPRGLFEPRPVGLPEGAKVVRVGPRASARATAARLGATWLRGPLARRPELFIGLDAASAAAAHLGRMFDTPSVGWWWRLGPLEALGAVDHLWVGDRAVGGALAARGRDSLLVPPSPATLGVPDGEGGDLVLVHAQPRPPEFVLEAVERLGLRERLRVVAGRPGLRGQLDLAHWREWLSDARAVIATDAESASSALLETLDAGRPVLVPAEAPPPWFEPAAGASFVSDKAESLADALAEVWAGRRSADRARRREIAAAEREGVAASQRIALSRALLPLGEPTDLVEAQP